MEEQVRRNMEMFERAFTHVPAVRQARAGRRAPSAELTDEIDDLKRQMSEMQKRLDKLSEKES